MKCPCEDSNGKVCDKPMTPQEKEQDGMCDLCACHVFKEILSFGDYKWEHPK